ncbi:MAG: alpha/beta hydrolase [Chloroflexi bacterium]|nr:alpha/beta hydrolase [Chloroflexota bacterium]
MPKALVNGINLYCEVHGRGEPLVLVAGMGADHRSWFPQMRPLKRHFTVITFDGRGIGKTDRPPGLYSFETLAADVVGLLDHLSLERAHILGESLGGIVAQEVAIGYPGRVMKLILANSTVGRGGDMKPHPSLMKAYGRRDGVTDTGFDPARVNIGRAMRAHIALSFNSRIRRLFYTLMATLYIRPSQFKGMTEQMQAISSHTTVDRLHLIQSPTLVITGTNDRLVPPAMSDILASRIPNARLVKVEGGSHALHVEMKRRFNREVLAFLAPEGSPSAP